MSLDVQPRPPRAVEQQLQRPRLGGELLLGLALVALTTSLCAALAMSGFRRVAHYAETGHAEAARAPEEGPGEAPEETPEETRSRLQALSASASRAESLALGLAVASGLLALATALKLIQRARRPLKVAGDHRHFTWDDEDPGLVDHVDLGAVVEAAQAFQMEAREAQSRLADAEFKGAQLAQTNDDLEGFVQSVSHDLKAPLASVTGFLRMARETLEEGDPEGALPMLHSAELASQRADKLVRELLELAKIGRSGDPRAVPLRAEVIGVLDENRAAIDAAGVEVEVAENLGVAFVDPRALRQILGNVIVNALKYGCTAARPTFVVSARQSERGTQLRIADNGPGIPVHLRGQAFDPFERLTESGEGTGLGLSLVERAMANAGGTVTVEETAGGGATFVLRFPPSSDWGFDEPTISTDAEDARGEVSAG